jgi:hypothetical protein
MVLCYTCERLGLPTVSSGQSLESVQLSSKLESLKRSAKTCELCNLFCFALADVRVKGIKNDAIRLHTWASGAQGDPVGISRVVIKIGDSVGRFIDVFAEQSITFILFMSSETPMLYHLGIW